LHEIFDLSFVREGVGGMTERERLQKQILELTEFIKNDEASVRSLTTDVNRDLLLQAIVLRKKKLADLMVRLAALRHS
jgi:hypothetical protein